MATAITTELSQLSEADNEDIITCAICEHSYDEVRLPKLLSACGHTFCITCAETLAQQSIVKCPTCRQETDINKTPLLTNFQLLEVTEKLASKASKEKKAEAICNECGGSIPFRKARCCKPCGILYPNILCSDCCVDKHNGHELVPIAKLYDERCEELSSNAKKYGKSMSPLLAKIENQQNDISLQLGTIQSLVQTRSHAYQQEVAFIIHHERNFDSRKDFEALDERQTLLYNAFRATETAFNDVVKLHEKVLSQTATTIGMLNGTIDNQMEEAQAASLHSNDAEETDNLTAQAAAWTIASPSQLAQNDQPMLVSGGSFRSGPLPPGSSGPHSTRRSRRRPILTDPWAHPSVWPPSQQIHGPFQADWHPHQQIPGPSQTDWVPYQQIHGPPQTEWDSPETAWVPDQQTHGPPQTEWSRGPSHGDWD